MTLLLAVLGACAGTFEMRVSSPQPDQVGSVYVLFADADFETPTEIVELIRPSMLQDYVGYAEYKLEVAEEEPSWRELSKSLPDQVEISVPESEPGLIAIELRRGLLKLHPQLALAVVVRTSKNAYYMKSWKSTVIAEAESPLVVRVTGDGVAESFQ